jgi:hypothetical protein
MALRCPLPELSESVVGLPFMISGLGALPGLVAAALAVRTRMKRASQVERLQLKWLAFGAALVPAAVVTSLIENAITGGESAATVIASVAALTATFAAVSLTLGVAIGSGSTVPTAAATLVVALVFGPLRSHVQVLVDRRFDRARYEGLRKVERFLEELRAGAAAPEATGEVIGEALGDPGLELFFWLPVAGRHSSVERFGAGSRATHTAVQRAREALDVHRCCGKARHAR